jgi:hypothetical protein
MIFSKNSFKKVCRIILLHIFVAFFYTTITTTSKLIHYEKRFIIRSSDGIKYAVIWSE